MGVIKFILYSILLTAFASFAWAGTAHLADPTRPWTLAELHPKSGTLGIQMLVVTQKDAYAVIDDITVHAGDKIGMITIDRITKEGVWITEDNQPKFIPLVPELRNQK